jgi:hypothetical protein
MYCLALLLASRATKASKSLDGYKGQLDNLLITLRLVQDEPELQTPVIEEQIQVVVSLGEGLQDQLDAPCTLALAS